MNKRRIIQRICSMLLTALLVFVLGVGSYSPASADQPRQDIPTIDPVLLSQSERSDNVDFLIYFTEKADLSAAYQMDWEERGRYVVDTLTAQAEKSQARVRKFLDETDNVYQPFWVANVILVESSTKATLNGLMSFTEIESLQSIPQMTLVEPIAASTETQNIEIQEAMSNLTRINADDVWTLGFLGEGMVVGSIDTGVRFTHEALINQYRGNKGGGVFDHNYHWWDAVNGYATAYDDHSHGSHVTGIMVGTDGSGNQIGVAPGAEWIACKGIASDGLADGYDLLECGQFMLAPWDLTGNNPNTNLRPHVVNNSWGGGHSYHNWFQSTVDAWLAAGIYPIFANGNSGPGLGTVNNPARYGNVTGVGATSNSTGQLASFSSWGPTEAADTVNPNGYPYMKPQFMAPGVGIRSAVATSNTAYQSWNGTSMAAPHAAGLVVLMWQAGPCLLGNYAQTETILQNTAVPIPYGTGNGDEGPGNIPNHATGWGEIDALAAVNGALDICEDAKLKGIVKDKESQLPIPDAAITVTALNNSLNDRSGSTDHNGEFEILVYSNDSYEITASKFGYDPEVILLTDVLPGETVMNFNLNDYPLFYNFLPIIN